MRKICLCFLFLVFLTTISFAQKKEIMAARDLIKQSTNLDKAELSMSKLLEDSANLRNEKIWTTLFAALQKQYDSANEKFYLCQQVDTASFFSIAYRLFSSMERFDSIDAQPDKKGKARLKYRRQNALLLNNIRPNLFNGGVFFISKKEYGTAYKFFNQYIEASNLPLFQSFDYPATDNRLPTAAFCAVYCGYKLKDAPKVYHNAYLALKDTSHAEQMLQYLSATYILDGDTARCIETLNEGFHRYPLSPYFFSHLIDYYSSQHDWKSSLALTNEALKADSTNKIFLLTKSSILLNMADYEESYAISDSLISVLKWNHPEAFLNAGLAKYNEAVAHDKNISSQRHSRKDILNLYREAMPLLEKYRELEPQAKDKWGLPLYTIYLNLNMGESFDEIDRLINTR